MEAKELLGTMDGQRWAEEFCQRFPQCEVDSVLGWFCNAIMAGYDNGKKLGIKEVVEWINKSIPISTHRDFFLEGWQSQVKEWGVLQSDAKKD